MVSGQGIYLSYNVGPALREGAGIAVANGLPYAQALRAITQNAGHIWLDPVPGGTLVAGAAAALVIWGGDPLEPASAPVAGFFKRTGEDTAELPSQPKILCPPLLFKKKKQMC